MKLLDKSMKNFSYYTERVKKRIFRFSKFQTVIYFICQQKIFVFQFRERSLNVYVHDFDSSLTFHYLSSFV